MAAVRWDNGNYGYYKMGAGGRLAPCATSYSMVRYELRPTHATSQEDRLRKAMQPSLEIEEDFSEDDECGSSESPSEMESEEEETELEATFSEKEVEVEKVKTPPPHPSPSPPPPPPPTHEVEEVARVVRVARRRCEVCREEWTPNALR